MSETSYVPTFGKKKSKGKVKQDTSMLIRQINQRIEEVVNKVNNDRKEFENKVNERIRLMNISLLTLLESLPKQYVIGNELDMKMKEIKILGWTMEDDSAVPKKYVLLFDNNTYNAGDNKIVNLEDPIALQDAATKNYVDNQISSSIDNSEKQIMKTLADEIKKFVTKPELNQATENIANAMNTPINTMSLNVNNLLSRVTQLERRPP